MIEVPQAILTSEVLSTKARVLLAMISTCDESLTTHCEAWAIAKMLGLVDESGKPTRQGLKAVRQARQALNKDGVLRATKVHRMVTVLEHDQETQEQFEVEELSYDLSWVWTVNL